ncbi:aldo/keto reductase [Sorangium sp. So ce124]|uniref:aldo/keto reductase n=1 Tax=Sorangium sp. So ce124 TaxID=3133280 RepID=UPI003F5DB4AF
MNSRPLGDTGISVSEIGLGAWQLANPDWGIHDRAAALRIIDRSLDAGCTFFDTAPAYAAHGRGLSEELLGQALKHVRQKVVICTKFGRSPEGSTNFDTSAIRPSLEGSLRRLQTDYVDILLLHSPPRELMDGRCSSQYAELEKLKTEGKLRVYGVSLDWRVDAETVVETTRSKALEVLYNVFHQEPGGAFPAAKERGVGLIAKVPLDSGWLSGRYRRDAEFTDVRRRWSPEVLARRTALVERLADLLPPGTSMTHAALQYILAQPQVSTVIPGAKSVEQALDNFAAANARLAAETVDAIRALWQRELKDDPLPW